LLGENGDVLAQSLIMGAALTVRRDGGIYYPIPGDNWNSYTYEAVLTVDPALAQEFTTEVTDRIWVALGTVFNYHGREDIQSLVIEQAALPLPAIAADWRDQAAGRLSGTRERNDAERKGVEVTDRALTPEEFEERKAALWVSKRVDEWPKVLDPNDCGPVVMAISVSECTWLGGSVVYHGSCDTAMKCVGPNGYETCITEIA
jgi:hypothetical protein